MSITDTRGATDQAKPKKHIEFTIRSADGETAPMNEALDDSLQSVLAKFEQKTHFTVAANQLPFFQFEGRTYEDLSKPVSVIEGLEDKDEVALLIRPRAGRS